MPPARLFISHSARTDPVALALIERLHQELDGGDLEVLVDKISLESGEDWNDQLIDWMLECHGAVLLLSKKALQSAWVEQEATILNLRKREDEDFELIPVFLDGVDDTVLRDPTQSRLSALDLPRLQAHRAGYVAGEDALLELLREKSEALRQRWAAGPGPRLLRAVAAQLTKVPDLSLQDFAEALDARIKQWLWSRRDKLRIALALRMFGLELKAVVQALETLALSVDLQDARIILELLAPFPVNAQAAQRLAQIIAGQPSCLGVCLNASEMDTGFLYARRACGSYLAGRLQGVTNADAGLGRDALRQELLQAIFELAGADDLQEAQDQLEFDGKEHIVVFPASRPDGELLQELSKLFPTLRFCCLAGSLAELPAGSVLEVLQPLLPPQGEQSLLKPYRQAKTRLRTVWKRKEE